MSKESPIRNQNKQPKKIVGFMPGAPAVVSAEDMFQMDEDIAHGIEKTSISSPPAYMTYDQKDLKSMGSSSASINAQNNMVIIFD